MQLINHLSTTSIIAANIKDWTSKDDVLSKVARYLLVGWPSTALGDEFKPYTTHKDNLSLQDGCIL